MMKKLNLIFGLILTGYTITKAQCPIVTCPGTFTIPSCTSGQTLMATSNYSANISSKWSTLGNVPISSIGTSSSIVNLNASGTYTVEFKDNSSNCITSKTVSVLCYTPGPTFTPLCTSYSPICPNFVNTLNISGASTVPTPGGPVSYTLLIPGVTSTVIPSNTLGFVSTFTITSCGTVIFICRDNTNTCYSSYSVNIGCPTITPVPPNVSGSNTVCLGSSTSFSANGSLSYTWSNGATTPTFTILPGTNTVCSVAGTDNNGCVSTSSIPVFVNSNCADVWPGDANSDGVVNSSDVLELGLQFGATGAARTPGGNTYVSQFANSWTGLVSTGKNKCHADCNGDGIVNNSDTMAITNNFSLTHTFKPAGPGSNGDITLVADNNICYVGQWNKADILLGSSSNNINNIYGLVFDLDIDPSFVESNSPYLLYIPSFLKVSSQNIEFRKGQLNNSKIYGASVRTDHTNVSGNGVIAELWFKVKADAPNNSSINLTVSNAQMIGNLGALTALTGGTTSVLVSTNLVGIENMDAFENSVQFFPNPARDKLIFQNSRHEETSYLIYDLIGQLVVEGKFSDASTLEIGALANGTYLVKLESDSGKAFKKLIIEK
ncbi:MAG: T9SS type A sorting domain-containing protein [bacterium]|nr:T9SS type A sorting domain-containing protein [bacterium]